MKKNYTYSDIEANMNKKYNSTTSQPVNNENATATSALFKKVDDVKLIMHNNITNALQNTAKLEDLEVRTEELQAEAGVFRTNAKKLKNKMWWKKWSMIFIFSLILIILIIIISLVIYYESSPKK
jgi:hypothetical protein